MMNPNKRNKIWILECFYWGFLHSYAAAHCKFPKSNIKNNRFFAAACPSTLPSMPLPAEPVERLEGVEGSDEGVTRHWPINDFCVSVSYAMPGHTSKSKYNILFI